VASVRKRKPLTFKEGGRVPVVDDVGDIDRETPARTSPGVLDPDEAVRNVIRAHERAEAMQRRVQTVDEYIDGLDVSDQKRTWLKANPEVLRPENATTISQRHAETQRLGIADDSPEFFDYLRTGVLRADDGKFVAEDEPAPVIERRLTPPPPAPPPPIKRRMPMTAPVSRDAPVYSSGQRTAVNTLTREEVQMAHLSYRDMPKVEAERLYLQQKQRLHQMREDGAYPMPERG